MPQANSKPINDSGDPVRDCQLFLATVTTDIAAKFHPTQPVQPLLAERCAAVDTVLGHLWRHHLGDREDLCLAAVGGYGRGELYPYSDIDLLVLGEQAPDEATATGLSELLRNLWDMGLKVGSSVRTLDECGSLASDDLTIFTTMLEARWLTGGRSLFDQLEAVLNPERMWNSKLFYLAKLDETEARHDHFGNTENNLEPHVKNGPGGLRDIQVIGWIARRHYGVAIEDLDEVDFLNGDEKRMLEAGQNFIGQVRFALHTINERGEDRLLFEQQQKLAQLWEMVDGEKLAVEQFMQVYYRWAQALAQLRELVMQAFDRQILHPEAGTTSIAVNEDFEARGGLLSARRDDVFIKEPANLLRAFVILANSPEISGMAPGTWRLLRASHERIDPQFRADPVNQALFMELIRSPHGVTLQLRRMARHGLLGKYLPEFGRIVGQMQFDLFHAYTVEAHTLEVLANTRRFMRADYTDKFPVSTRIAQRLRAPELLYIAALYHDIGKGRGGDHSELGAVDAQGFCERHGLNRQDTELVVWLVRNHLLMSSFSQRKDISDPDEIQRFAAHVATQERLDYLYTLTVADIHGTNPELWNAWRSTLLRQTYTETRRALSRGLENPVDRQSVVDTTRAAAAELLEYRGFTSADIAPVWARRGDDYFLRERPDDIAWHTEAIADHSDLNTPLVLVRQSTDSTVANATQIFVHAPDQPDLFARVCAELEFLDLSVNDARVYLGSDGATLDTFYVLQADGNPVPGDSHTLNGISEVLTEALTNRKIRSVTRRTPRRQKSFVVPTETSVHQDERRGWTVLEIATPDRPGLLANLGEVFVAHDVALQAAKIQTLGERVEDVFFITSRDGKSITDPQRLSQLETAIKRSLDTGLQGDA
ncbi:MAG: [protein-PII] uridylyltransferase [Luminiphilus sp.]|nr:[protein-PII] uridylyltransferase [Luminiphilus sp.]